MHILGVVGPFQMIILLFIVGLIIVLPIVLIVSRAKHKARANTLDDVLSRQTTASDDKFFQLERLTNLRASGALTQEEFEREKRKILG